MTYHNMNLRNTLLGTTLAALALAAGLAWADAPGDDSLYKDLAVEQRPMAQLQAPPSDMSVTAWVDHSDNTYRPGQNVTLYVKSNRDAYLTVLDVGTSGKVHVIFPNRYQTDNFVRAGQTVQVPGPNADFDFRVGGPSGVELIKVITTRQAAPLFRDDDMRPAGPYQALAKGAPMVAKDLEVVLRQDPTGHWAEYDKVIRIVP